MSQQINLFNPIFLKQKKIFSAITLLQMSGLVLLGAVLVAIYTTFQSAELNRNAGIVAAQLRTAQAQVARLRADASAPAKSKALEDALVKVEAEIKSRQQISSILQKNDFGNTTGFSAYLVAFARQIPNGLWLTGFNISRAGNEIGLQGRTLKPELLPLYVTQLKREPVMQGKSFAELQMQIPRAASAAVASNVGHLNDIIGAATQGKSEAGKQPDAAPYIEFNLRSSITAEKANMTGVTGK
ncbi:MAG: PilN domain-containing protein [Undibacterium sp.]|uniref:PilN domain-containing protein n=1 Tax=Undibacterium sp. TaxID=1914977 RepID=UPI0027188E52|nr:PilN domain-containing protein [Undibacterium sp.]MDO8651992.1 PilN domain-containing protein [Undibacterium sp.]